MKRKAITILCSLMAVIIGLGLTACGSSDNPYAKLNLDDYLKVPEYTGISIQGYTATVTEAEVMAKIKEDMTANAKETELKKGDKVKNGDTLNIDYKGLLNGKPFEGGTAEGQTLEIGSNSFIAGFESGLIGKKIGDKVSLNLTFPADYSAKKLAGKDVVFKVKINSGTRKQAPEYTEAYVKKNTDYKSKKEYEKAVKKQLKEQKENTALREQKNAIWTKVLDKTDVTKYPEDMVDRYKQAFSDQADYYAEQYGMDRAQFLSQYYQAKDENEFAAKIEDSAKALVKQEMLVEYIADKEDITYTDEEAEELQKNIESQGYDEEAVQRETGRNMEEYIHIELLYEKVQDFLLEKADIKG